MLCVSPSSYAEQYTIPLLVSASPGGDPQGVLRLLNGAQESGSVSIYAIDDSGERFGPATFTLNASAAVEISATDLARGNTALGLTGAIGTDIGDARLVIETDLPIVALAYLRAIDGMLSSMHDTLRGASGGAAGDYRYEVPYFNPGVDVVHTSRLRLINANDSPAEVTIYGRDDYGASAAGGEVRLTLPPQGARTLTATQLEAGDPDLTGRLGSGMGKWRLSLVSDRPLQVLNMVATTAGYLNNLSTTPPRGAAPADAHTFSGRFADRALVHRSASGRTTFSPSAGRLFTETVESQGITETYTGSYDYELIEAAAGRLTLAYADRGPCRRNLYFASHRAGWFATRCDSDDDPDGEWTGGGWSVEGDRDNGGDGVNGADERLADLPASGAFIPATLVDGSLSTTALGTTILLTGGGYFELNDATRYTCTAPGGCAISNGTLTRGAVARRTAGIADGVVDRVPVLSVAVGLSDRTFAVGTAIDALTLPTASGGDGSLTYRLSPKVPGLSFDPATRQVTGTPTRAGAYALAYSVTDQDGDAVTLSFNIMVEDHKEPAAHHAALVAGLPENPFAGTTLGGTEGAANTVGTLRLDLNPDAFPVITLRGETPAVLVAASRLGNGRVVALPGQDFISPGERATLLGNANLVRLLANAVRWVGSGLDAPLRVLVDNRKIADALAAQGLEGIEVVGLRDSWARDWSADALVDVDVAIVLANDWGTARLIPESIAPLRAFAERGGGLIVAGSKVHWNWWIEERHGPFAADRLLRGTGISWNEDEIDEIETATTKVDARATPGFVWGEYVDGAPLDASQMALLLGVFNSALELGRTEELDVALARLVREAPPLPTASANPAARLAASVAETLGPYKWPEAHPWAAVFPGTPAASARRVDGIVTLDATWSEFPADAARRERHLPLGYYAPPGALVVIEVPPEHATGELRVSVGELYDSLGDDRWGGPPPEWRRAPKLRREFSLADRQTNITNAYGGSIALILPADYAGTIPVTVRGAIPMALYTAGESTADEWRAGLDAGAPQAIIQKPGSIRLVISAENAHSTDDPGEVQAFWDEFQKHHAELAGEPVPRAYESIWIFDPQVGWGYANAGWDRINYPLHGEHWALLPGTLAGREYLAALKGAAPPPHRVPSPGAYSPETHGVDWWLFGHELGHQWQTDDWGYGPASRDVIEVAVNLFTMYTLNFYVFGGDEFNVYAETRSHGCAKTLDHAELASLRWSTASYCERLALYRQLINEFGWKPMRRVFHSYYDPAYPRETYGSELDGFAIRFSAMIERDLVAFLRHWQYPLSDSAADVISGFEYEEWLPPGW